MKDLGQNIQIDGAMLSQAIDSFQRTHNCSERQIGAWAKISSATINKIKHCSGRISIKSTILTDICNVLGKDPGQYIVPAMQLSAEQQQIKKDTSSKAFWDQMYRTNYAAFNSAIDNMLNDLKSMVKEAMVEALKGE